jgi:hypothetical protein
MSERAFCSRRVTTTPTCCAACARQASNKPGRSGGGNRIALWAAGKSFVRSGLCGGYAARTDLPRSLAMAWRSI